ncbi:nitrilase-related carbon-nitrogen hydrolase [Desulforegula conservatrix]|uniref:nitrilase-related carbon-nitrogen hydrolase n=1 Tax=Desulforegula conservatrix TaxID=153026 RepID=UPI000419CD76|nr:nitrilase-related carbon-nitrogen hydrolase [Desulforegula conservatrix]
MPENIIKIAIAISNSQVGKIALNIEAMKRQVNEAASNGASLICFPEMNITGYYNSLELKNWSLPNECPELDIILQLASSFSITILAGFSEIDPEQNVYATHGVFYPNGQKYFYRKLHIAPPEKGIFQKGSEVPVFDYLGVKFGVQLCYDAHFPDLSTIMSLKGVDLIFFPHASPRGNSEKKMLSWLRHLTARAFDNGIYVAACNQCGENGKGLSFPGVALVVSPSGELESSLLTENDDILYLEFSKKTLADFRSSRMKYFLPNRRTDLFDL